MARTTSGTIIVVVAIIVIVTTNSENTLALHCIQRHVCICTQSIISNTL